MTKQDISKEYCLKFPDTPNRTLAKLLLKDHPTVFLTLEMARRAIRYSRGANGERHRKRVAPTEATKPLGWQKNLLPKTANKKREPLVIKGNHRILVLSDIHVPYHDTNAVETAIEYGKKIKPTIILLNGDIGDFYAISRHDKDPSRVLKDELDAIRQFLFWLRQSFPKARIIYKIGNHENRMERFLVKYAPVLLGVTDFEISTLLRFDELKIELADNLQLVMAGKLPIYHGHELPQGISNPVNPARGMWMRVQESLLCGHWHRTSEHTESTGLTKKYHSCWSAGCLCDLSPDYAIVNRWNHGFVVVDLSEDGNFEVHNHKIIKGRVY